MSTLRDEALKLPELERVALAIALYESLLEDPNCDPAQRTEAHRKLKDLRRHTVANGVKQ